MCGIAGIVEYCVNAERVDQDELLRIREAMSTRGPDGAGLWLSPDGLAGLAHRRLTIIDLTSAGAQPMTTGDGRYRITFNGEIYNYRALKRELEAEGCLFQSNCDTEVLLHLYARRGAAMLERLTGDSVEVEVRADGWIGRSFEIHEDDSVQGVTIELAEGGSIEGTIDDDIGDPVAGADIEVHSIDGEILGATTSDGRGRWQIDGVPEGDVMVVAEPALNHQAARPHRP